MFGGIDPSFLLASVLVAAVPILFAAIGELVAEKAGVLNLGVEGMMIIGAICGFITAVQTGSPVLGFAGGAAGGAALSLIFAFLTQYLLTNQVATGLALTLFGIGVSSLLGQGFVGIKPPATGPVPFGPLRDIPFFGRVVFGHDWVVYASVLVIALVWVVLRTTRTGLVLRAVGESAEAAHALGYSVRRVRMAAIVFGGAMAGTGGAYLSLVRVPQWVDGITAGAGWIALAIVVFASWQPWRVLVGAYLFGGIAALQLNIQAAGGLPFGIIALLLVIGLALDAILQATLRRTVPGRLRGALWALTLVALAGLWLWGIQTKIAISVEYLSMAPYLITILVLVFMSIGRGGTSLNAPATLGQSFHAAR